MIIASFAAQTFEYVQPASSMLMNRTQVKLKSANQIIVCQRGFLSLIQYPMVLLLFFFLLHFE